MGEMVVLRYVDCFLIVVGSGYGERREGGREGNGDIEGNAGKRWMDWMKANKCNRIFISKR